MRQRRQVIIMRGLPGSGKSYETSKILEEYPNAVVCSADHFFMRDGKYVFVPEDIGKAHSLCRLMFMTAIIEQKPVIIVDNTNTVWKEMEYYVGLAKENYYDINIRESSSDWAHNIQECFRRNTHNVPFHVLEKMRDRWESTQSIEEKIKSM